MSVQQNIIESRSTKIPWKGVALTAAVTIVAFLASPGAPLGGFWPPSHQMAPPTPVQLSLFMVMSFLEALGFGLAVSFLIFGWPLIRAISPASPRLTRLAHLAIVWSLGNWWFHDSLHTHNGLEPNGLLAIEYSFHVPLMIAAGFLAYFFLILVRAPSTTSR